MSQNDVELVYELSPLQQAMLFHSVHSPGSGVYVIQVGLRLTGALDADAFVRAFEHVASRHGVLRTAFYWEDLEKPLQVVYREAEVPVLRESWRDLSEAGQRARFERYWTEDRERGFDLSEPPLMRLALFEIGEGDHRFVWSLHHLLTDGWALGVLLREVFSSYEAFRAGREPSLPLPRPYRDYIAWIQRQDLGQAEAFWRKSLAGLPEPTLLSGGDARTVGSFRESRQRSLKLTTAETAALREAARRQRLTLNTMVQGAWALLLSRWTGSDDVVFGAVVAGRPADLPGVESMVGLFINTLPVRVKVAGEARPGAWLAGIQERHAEMSRYEHTPLHEVQRWSGLPAGTALFDTLLAFENYPLGEAGAGLPGLRVSEVASSDLTNFPLTLSAHPGPELSLGMVYDAARFEGTAVARLLEHLAALLSAFAAEPDGALADLPRLLPAERQQVLAEWSGTAPAASAGACLHELVAAQAERTPSAVALVHGNTRQTYAELMERAGGLARWLRAQGVGPEARVAVCLERSPDLIVSLLGVLAAGGAYVPVDPAYPLERRRLMLEDSGAVALVTRGRLAADLSGISSAHVLDLDAEEVPGAAWPTGTGAAPGHLAYVIYTSGSTGRPKGVAIEHRSAVARMRWAREEFSPDELSGVLAATSVCFDLSVFEIFAPLAWGGRVILAENAVELPALPAASEVRLVNTVPSAAAELARTGLPASVRTVNLAGEPLPAALVERLYATGTVARVLNLYGPSEDTTYSTGARVPAGDGRAPSIGRPLPGTRAHVVDRRGWPVPPGVAGELWLSGAGLSRGYLGRPELTAERYAPDPFGEPGGRVYRTGDLVRHRADGELEFLGRIDHQVKIRGFRIELGEIEAVLASHPAIREAAVAVREDSPGQRRLVAYVAGEGEAAAELRGWLSGKLPDHMVPSVFVPLDALPRTPNGKVDRRALPAPERAPRTAGIVAPRTATEATLVEVWKELLGLEQAGVEDGFFELGGHSLLATRVLARVRHDFGVEIALREVFSNPTVADLAALIDARTAPAAVVEEDELAALLEDLDQLSDDAVRERLARLRQEPQAATEPPPLARRPRPEDVPLSFAQQRLWLLDQLEPGNPAYNLPLAVRLSGRLPVDLLTRIFTEVVRRHEVLRTTFAAKAGRPVQVIAPFSEAGRPELAFFDLSDGPEAEREARARELALAEARRPFDLARGPLLRLGLARLGPEDHLLLITLHHIVSDGWSMGVLLQEIAALHEAFSGGRPSPLPELPVQYADFALWQREWLEGEALEAQLSYWKRQLAGAPQVLALPTDRPRPAAQTYRGSWRPVALTASLSEGVREICRREGATPFMALLAAWALLLGRHAGQEDVLLGSPIAGRSRREIEGLIGFFVNTLVLRADLSGAPSFAGLLGRVRQTALDAYAHQDLPFERLVLELAPDRNLAHSPLFQVMMGLQNAPSRSLSVPGLTLTPLPVDSGLAKFDLTLTLREGEDRRFEGSLEHNSDLFDATTAMRLWARLSGLLEAALAHPETPVSALPLLLPAERHQALVEWNDTAQALASGARLHELVARQAERTPGAVAVSFEDQDLTYGELDRRANRLAHYLIGLGVEPDGRVGVLLERSPERVVALLAILKAGAAWVPLDPEYPAERLAVLVESSGARVVITEELLDREETGKSPETAPAVRVEEDNLAYVLFTSGSTGTPKGVMVTHRGIVNRLLWAQEVYRLTPDDVVLQKAPASFDFSVWETFAPLLAGARLVLAEPGGHRDPAYLVRTLARRGVTIVHFVPSMLGVFLEEPGVARGALRQVFAGGEALPPAFKDRVLERLGVPLDNQYGPTEISIDTTRWVCRPGPVSLGRPIGNARLYVVDRELQPQPPGVAGELLVGGAGPARGYLGRPDLTATAFVPDPFGEAAGARLYRTGDLVRLSADGNLEFLGRIDYQVKVRGFRIELGEIEAVLGSHPAVRECVVVAREDGPGGRRLVAYVTGDALPEAAELQAHLARRLPEHMVPGVFVSLTALPQTPSGKVDRKALPAPERPSAEDYVAPADPVEELLAGIWAEVLGLERVGARDHFFALGGHSLLATQVISRIRETLGVELPLRRIFEAPTVAELARAVREGGESRESRPIASGPREGDVPLSFAQQRLWFLDQFEPGNPAYNVPLAVRLEGRLPVDLLAGIFAEVVRRHETLRTTFGAQDGRPAQVVSPPARPGLPVVDLSGLPVAAREPLARDLRREEARRPFDLKRGPLLRLRLLRLAESEHLLFITLHHIVSDGWSMGVLLREVAALYEAFSEGRPSPLPELPVQYAGFSRWQREWLRGEVLEAQLAYWKRQLAGAPPELTLPTDRPRPAVQTFRGAWRTVQLPPALSEAVHGVARERGATPFMVLVASWAVLLGRHAGQEDVLLGTPVAGRNRREIEDLIGFFVNTLVLRVDLSGAPSFGELLDRVRRTALDAYAHQDLPFERIVEELVPDRNLAHSPLFQAMVALQNVPWRELSLPELSLTPLPMDAGVAKLDLTLTLREGEDRRFEGALEHNTDLFDTSTAARLWERFSGLLEAALAHPETSVSALPLLLPAERHQALVEWNDTAQALASGARLHELVALQAERAPGAVAVVFEDEELTYGELDRRANRLAHHLIGLGVEPDGRVGVLLERSPERVVALLAILKAGAAWVPLDPEYPAERLAFLVESSGARVVINEELLDREEIGKSPDTAPAVRVEEDNLAYVLFTSGSTGTPKGVMVTHRGIVNRLLWAQEVYRLGPGDVVLQKAPASFDFSVWETFAPLLAGARLVLAEPGGHRDPAYLVRTLARRGVTIVHFVPSMLGVFLEEPGVARGALRQVFAGGEALPPALKDRCLERLGVPLDNQYGPTEISIDTTRWICRPGPVSLGRPIGNARLYVVDRELRPQPPGVAGELLVGGAGPARGYLGRPDLTAAAFVPDPFGEAVGARLYRTGDLVRLLADGNLEFLGRIDHQVKVRGFRIELGEIEAVLASHPAVRECVAVAREDGPEGRRLVAYVTGEALPDAGELQAHLAGRLPDYMVPGVFVPLTALPRTPSGKVDRKALPAPERAWRDARAEFVAPRTPTEILLAEIWKELLGLEAVGAEDGFFELGGHSLLATQLVSRVRQASGAEIALREVFQTPTVAGLAALVDARAAAPAERGGLVPLLDELDRLSGEEMRARLKTLQSSRKGTGSIPRREASGAAPLSFSQQRLWLIDQLDPDSPAYNVFSAVRMTGGLSGELLVRIFAEVVRRHEVLRTTFVVREEGPVQVIAPPARPELPVVDLTDLPEALREARALALAREEGRRPFDLACGPLLRLALVRLAEREHLLLVTMHHIVSDGWSMSVLLAEIGALYEAFSQGRPSPLPELPVQYADFAVWQRSRLEGEALEESLGWWRRELAGVPEALDLPLDRLRSPEQTLQGETRPVRLSAGLGEGIRNLSRRSGATPFMVLIAAFQALLHRFSGQDDVLVGTPVANRNRFEIERLIGFFVNTLVLRGRFEDGGLTFGRLLAATRETALGAFGHQDMPFEKLVEELAPERNPLVSPLFQVFFTLQNAPRGRLSLSGLSLESVPTQSGLALFDLSLELLEHEGGFAGSIEYRSDLFDGVTIARLLASFHQLLSGLVAEPDRRIAELPLLGEAARHQAVVEWNEGASRPSPDVSVVAMFERRADLAPDAPALSQAGRRLTYGELDRRANQLAYRLRLLGVGPESRVAVLAERSPELVVAFLGILKAGGAYVPLDPAYPQDRLAYMLEDSSAAVLLTTERLTRHLALEGAGPVTLRLDGPEGLENEPEGRPDPGPVAGQIAYVLYTSGSTGGPKGVLVPHGALARYAESVVPMYGLGPGDRMLQFCSISFDVSLDEIVSALTSGAELVLRTEEMLESAAVFLEGCRERGITVLDLPTAYWHEVVAKLDADGLSLPPCLRLVIVGGERALPERVAAWRRHAPERPRLLNGYGVTEATITSTFGDGARPSAAEARGEVSIGRAIPGAEAYVLDREGQPVPIGVAGELHLGDDRLLARGYLNRPDLTAERFVPHPFPTEPGARLYRSGDLARALPGGELEFVGRRDRQVKVRGFRIEVEEIEARLLEHPEVSAAVVAVRTGPGGDPQIVGYVVPRPGQEPAPAVLRAFLREALPEYMVPGAFVTLEALPLTPNGKVDRRSLPAPDPAARQTDAVAPRTRTEEILVEIWKELLGLTEIGVEDRFFDLGGHSLLATQVLARVRQTFGVEISLRDVFQSPTVAGLAERIEAEGGSASEEDELSSLLDELDLLSDEEARARLDELSSESGDPRYV